MHSSLYSVLSFRDLILRQGGTDLKKKYIPVTLQDYQDIIKEINAVEEGICCVLDCAFDADASESANKIKSAYPEKLIIPVNLTVRDEYQYVLPEFNVAQGLGTVLRLHHPGLGGTVASNEEWLSRQVHQTIYNLLQDLQCVYSQLI